MPLPIPRVHAVELNDQPWVPAVLRDTIVETLSRTLRWGKILEGLVDPFQRFLDLAGASEVLDLGSGAGGPAAILSDALAARGRSVRFHLTDLFPRPELWEDLRATRPNALSIVHEPVDATNIPAHLSRGRARVILNVLHHFPPNLARAVLRSAVDDRAALFVAEGFERKPYQFLPFAPVGIPALALSPFLSRDRRVARACLTWLTPIALLASTWDGVVSTLRVYTEAELREMVGDAPAYTFTYGRYRYAFGGEGYYFYGVPRTGGQAAA